MKRMVRICVMAIAGLAAVTCANAAVHEVQIVDYQFIPSTLTVAVGDSIHWTNDGIYPHTVTSGQGCTYDNDFTSGTLNAGQGWGYKVDAGDMGLTKNYFCTFHCTMGMTASFTVRSDTAVEQTTWGKIRTLYK